jgi:hypothetical protein
MEENSKMLLELEKARPQVAKDLHEYNKVKRIGDRSHSAKSRVRSGKEKIPFEKTGD